MNNTIDQNNTIHYIDHCNHGSDNYIGSIIRDIKDDNVQWIDIYVYNNHGSMNICARYGSEDHEYISIGKIEYLISGMYINHEYKLIYDLIRFYYDISLIKKESDTSED